MRLVYLWTIRDGPLVQVLLIDSETYDRLARRILAGSYRGEEIYSVNVLYPYFLAAVYALVKSATMAALAVQAVLDSVSCTLVAWIGRRLFSPAVGLLAGLTAATYGPMVFYTGALLTPSLIAFLGLVAIALLVHYQVHPKASIAGLAGVAVGLATLARGNHLLFVAVSIFFFLVAAKTYRLATRHWAWFAAAALALVALVIARNYMVEGEWVPVAANYAAFYIGHNAEATGLYAMPSFIESARFESEVWGAREAVATRLGHDVTLAESARYLFGEGVRFALANPLAELRLLGTKLYYFWNVTESPTNLNYYFARDHAPLLRWLPISFGLVAPLALLGMFFARREWRGHLALHLYVAVAIVTALLFFVSAEYRLAAVPVLMVFAAHAVVVLARNVLAGTRARKAVGSETSPPGASGPQRKRRHAPTRQPVAWLSNPLVQALVLLPPLLVACNYRTPRLASQSLKRVDYLNFGTLYKERGDLATARAFFERALAIDPRYRPAYQQLASLAAARGDQAEAARLTRVARGFVAPGEAPERDPADHVADSLLVVASDYRAGDYESALAGFESLRQRSQELGDPALTRSLANNVGLCHYKLGAFARAESVFAAILAEDSSYVNAHTNLGRVFAAQGRAPEAIARYEYALKLDPENRSAITELAKLGRAPSE